MSARSPEKRPVWQAWPGHPLLKDSVQPSSVQRGVADVGGLRVRGQRGRAESRPRALRPRLLPHALPPPSPGALSPGHTGHRVPAAHTGCLRSQAVARGASRPGARARPGAGSRPHGGFCLPSSVTLSAPGGRALPCHLPPLTQPSAGGRLAGQAAPGDGGSLAPGPWPFFSRVTSAESGIPWASVSPSEVSRRPRGRARSQDLHPHREEPSARASQKTLPPRPPARAVRAVPVCARRVRDTGPQDAA